MRKKTTVEINNGDTGRYFTDKCRGVCAGFLVTEMRPDTDCVTRVSICAVRDCR